MAHQVRKRQRFVNCGCCSSEQTNGKIPAYCKSLSRPRCAGDSSCPGSGKKKDRATSRVCYTDSSKKETVSKCVNPFKEILENPEDSYTCGECGVVPDFMGPPPGPRPTPVSPPPPGPRPTPVSPPTSPPPSTLTDCGCPQTCTSEVLDRMAATFPCRDRINWVMGALQKTETEACQQLSDEFPDVCGDGCDPRTCNSQPVAQPTTPINCGCSSTCTDAVLDTLATDNRSTIACRERILWAVNILKLSEIEACASISSQFPDTCGVGCDPNTCEIDPPAPTNNPTPKPVPAPTKPPTRPPTPAPVPAPTKPPTRPPTPAPVPAPTKPPTWPPTPAPVPAPTKPPTRPPTPAPTKPPTRPPTPAPTKPPTWSPTPAPTNPPTRLPTPAPTKPPTRPPTPAPTDPSLSTLTDCGCPQTCTSEVLDRMAATFPCRDRINWVMGALQKTETEACQQLSDEFPDVCGDGCDPRTCNSQPVAQPTTPINCGCSSTCTDAVLDTLATDNRSTIACRERILWAVNILKLSEIEACASISSQFPDTCGVGCDPNTCEIDPPPGPMPSAPSPSPPAGDLVFAEEFDYGDQPDPAIWTYDQGDWGWGNAELQRYTNSPNNVQISNDGKLIIRAIRVGDSFTSGRIKTLNKFTFMYGHVEASIKVPSLGNGLWPAFWTLGNNFPVVGWPACGEIDVMEMGHKNAIHDGVVNERVGSAAHWEYDPGSRATYGEYLDVGQDLSQDFHVFSMDWTPDMITTYIDGQKVWEIDISGSQCPPEKCSEFHKHHFFLLNMAVGGHYTGLLTAGQITASFPAQLEIDYLRVYSNDWTEVGGTYMNDGIVPRYDLTDCGCAETCTNEVLSRMATDSNGSHSCRDRITWVISTMGFTEGQACGRVSAEFPSICGSGCNPESCT